MKRWGISNIMIIMQCIMYIIPKNIMFYTDSYLRTEVKSSYILIPTYLELRGFGGYLPGEPQTQGLGDLRRKDCVR